MNGERDGYYRQFNQKLGIMGYDIILSLLLRQL